ncbi:THO complex subunit 2 [Operophtera brumata]|uniref:THO complex subunit 2 n=1 Tax=Operophtera brumata TaxID=104452 RepID=A0A0L7LMI9_OPEBR|nr:THO complex subunit 2 [Operophtera brumata]
MILRLYANIFFCKQGSKEIEERSPEKEKRKAKLRGDERKERKMSRKRVSSATHTLSSVNEGGKSPKWFTRGASKSSL